MKKKCVYLVICFLLNFSVPLSSEEIGENIKVSEGNYQDYVLEIEKYKDPFIPLLGGKSYDGSSIKQKIKLEGILWSSINPLVLINGEILGPGDEIGGAIIEKIDKNRVFLRYNKKTFSLVFWE